MAWTELASLRDRNSRSYQDDQSNQRRWSGTLAQIHYESVLDSSVADAEIDCTPVRVDNVQFDGWRVVANDWHYALGRDLASHGTADGWVGFGGRQGQNWLKFRLLRVGYLHWPTRAWDDIGGAPTYDRADLVNETRSIPLGPNDDPINVESVATWDNIWTTPGAGAVQATWKVRGGQLKEEIVVNQAAREWITANRPPATPADETWFGFVFNVDWSDIPQVVRDSVVQDVDGDFADDGVPIEIRDSLDRLLAFMPIDAVIAGHAARGQPQAEWQAGLRKRFYYEGGNHYLLLGVRCDVLNGLQAGDLRFDPTFEIPANTSDCYYDQVNGFYVSGWAGTDIWMGTYDSQREYGGFRYTPTIPSGATITAANLSVRSPTGQSGTCPLQIVGDADTNAPVWSSGDHPESITPTTETVNWSPGSWTGGVWYDTPDLTDMIQEIIDLGGWASGQGMRMRCGYYASSTDERYCHDYNYSAANATEFDVTYTTGTTYYQDAGGTLGLAGGPDRETNKETDLAGTLGLAGDPDFAIGKVTDLAGTLGLAGAPDFAISKSTDLVGTLGLAGDVDTNYTAADSRAGRLVRPVRSVQIPVHQLAL